MPLGAVFPKHVAEWYDEFIGMGMETDGLEEFLAFRDMYKAAVGKVLSV